MGWLRDLMQGAQPPYRSFGALARAALAHPGWPDGVDVQPRSLATVFSKLDRDTDIEWLGDRPPVQLVLAELLGCSVADVQASIVAGSSATDSAARRLRLEDVRYARALDLADEPLPPGIPDAVCHPERWGRTWWVAPSGSGRSLVGRWLAARGLAIFAENQPQELATRAPVYLELTRELPAGLLPERDRLCVAAPFPPPNAERWTIVRSPSAHEYLGELVEWVAARLDGDAGFDAERAVPWLRSELTANPALDRFGVVLGLCGLIDELGARSVERQSLAQAARRIVELRLAEWRRNESGDTTGIERRAFDVLVGMLRHTLTDDDRPWSEPRHFDDWVQAVPPEYQRGADVDWLRLSLPRVDRTIRASDVERAARSMPPGAYRIVRAFRGARLLAPARSEDELALAPDWLAAVAAAEAERSLAAAAPVEWGEALLRPHAAAGVARAVVDRIARGDFALIDAVLEACDEDNPASVAAVEIAFIAAGSALLDGQDVPSELVDELWREQARLWLEIDGRTRAPRLLSGSLRAEWSLAMLALSEHARGATPIEPSLDEIEPLWKRAPIERAAAIAALIDRLRRARGSPPSHRLELASALLDSLDAGSSWEAIAALDDPERDLATLERLAAERGLDFERALRAIHEAWARAGRPALVPLFRAPALAARVPAALIAPLLERLSRDDFDFPWRVLDAAEIERLLAAPALPSPPVLGLLWGRFPKLVEARLDLELREPAVDRAVELLGAAPPEASAIWVRAFRERAALDRLSDRALNELRLWLAERVAERADGWRDAYALLADAERLIASSRLSA